MTTQEFSNEFDTLINSYSRYKDFDDKEQLDSIEFNEYEKSLFLTAAQEELLKEFYSGKNPFLDSFEKTEEIRRYLSGLIATHVVNTATPSSETLIPLSTLSSFYSIPAKAWYVTYEQVKFNDSTLGCLDSSTGGVIPITQDEYYKIMRNPFRGPSKNRVLRLDVGTDTVEIISKYAIAEYLVRYVSKPTPIVLETMPNGLSVDSVTVKTECSLHSALHRSILERAVYNALKSKSINSKAS